MTNQSARYENSDRQPAPPDSVTLAAIHDRLLAWFATAGRDLPWRKTRNPYHVLVSEMMLQQTQVDRVLPKYRAFLEVFPILESLAVASTAEVIRQWAGLGYNRRAVNLQRIARTIVEQCAGIFPQDVAELRNLPGIGPYTAGALACFAFEQDVAFMDTNIRRVVRRLLVAPENVPPVTSERMLLDLAQSVIPVQQGWSWNQALMEMGALICTSSTPACWRCPLRQYCQAYAAWQYADETVFTSGSSDTDEIRYQTRPSGSRRRAAERSTQPYSGSNRYYRGRVIDQLRTLPAGERLPLDSLGPLIKDDFDAGNDQEWLRKLAEGLARDGLVELADNEIGLPG